MIKSVGLLQRREGLDAAGFRDHYEQQHAPLARELLGFSGYQRNYPESSAAREGLGLDVFSEFWFRDAEERARIAQLMQGDVGLRFREDEFRFMNRPANHSYEVGETQHGIRPPPGASLRAIAIQRLAPGRGPGEAERRVDLETTRVREREISGVIASLYTVPRRAVKEPPAGSPGVGCIESLWLEGREVLDACNTWRREADAPILWEVEEVGAPILSPPP